MDISAYLPRLGLDSDIDPCRDPGLSIRCVVLGLSDKGCGGTPARISLHIRDIHMPDYTNLLLARTRAEAADAV